MISHETDTEKIYQELMDKIEQNNNKLRQKILDELDELHVQEKYLKALKNYSPSNKS